MIDEPGPWGSGPFALAEGHSVIDAEPVVIRDEPFAATWLQREERTPRVRLVANPHYWDKARGPYLKEVVFRNDLPPDRALDLVCTTAGEVDIVTEVPPAEAARVEASSHAKLVSIDAVRTVVAIPNRDSDRFPLHNPQARRALNLAVDRTRLVKEAYHGRAGVITGLLPGPARTDRDPHDPGQAAELWKQAGAGTHRPLRVMAWGTTGPAARRVCDDLQTALGLECELTVVPGGEEGPHRRRLAEKKAPQDWDLLVLSQGGQSADAPPLEQHRAFVGEAGEFRAGPPVPRFEQLYAKLVGQVSAAGLAAVSVEIDRFVSDDALVLFLCSPQALYAVNNHISFTPYRTTFELAGCRVGPGHWSRSRS